MSRREAWLSAGARLRRRAAGPDLGGGPGPVPDPGGRRPTTGASPATSPRGAGSCPTRSGSYATPARDPVTGAFGFFFPRPAFEIWLPAAQPPGRLPDAGSADPPTIRRTLPVAADRAGRPGAGRSPGGSPRTSPRSAALSPSGRGRWPWAPAWWRRVWLPLVLPSAYLDSDDRVRGAGPRRLPPHGPAGAPPTGSRALDPRLIALGLAIGDRRHWPATRRPGWALAWALVACAALWRRAGLGTRPGRRGRRPGRARGDDAVARPGLARLRLAAARARPMTNAFSISGFDIFAWNDPPTLARYLAAGPQAWVEPPGRRASCTTSSSVLVVPGFPVVDRGPRRPAWSWRRHGRCGRCSWSRLLTFWIATLAFPVARPGARSFTRRCRLQVLLLVAAPGRPGRGARVGGPARGWTRPVAWLGPTSPASARLLFMAPGVIAYGSARRPATEAGIRRRPGPDRARRATPSTARARSSPTTRSGSRRSAAFRPCPCPNETPADVAGPGRDVRGASSSSSTASTAAWPGSLDTRGAGCGLLRAGCPRAAGGRRRRRRLPGLPRGVPMSARILAAR